MLITKSDCDFETLRPATISVVSVQNFNFHLQYLLELVSNWIMFL